MCGIIGAFNKGKNAKPINEDMIDIFQNQMSRGQEGFGISFINKEGKVKTKRATMAAKTIVDLYQETNQSTMAIMHHRMPTSSENKLSQTHPIKVKNKKLKYNYLIIHNGVVSNCDELRELHKKKGFKYYTPRIRKWYNNSEEEEYNDSEALAIEVSMYIEKHIKKIRLEGSAAFIALQINKKTNIVKKVFFGRNDNNPLILSSSKNKIRLSSESEEGKNIEPFVLFNFSPEDFKLNKQKLKFQEKETTVTTEIALPTETSALCQNYNFDEKELFENNKNPYFEDDGFLEDNLERTEHIINSYYDKLDETTEQEISLFSTDSPNLEILFNDTMKKIALELKGAKEKTINKAIDILTDRYEKEHPSEEEILAEEEILTEEKILAKKEEEQEYLPN